MTSSENGTITREILMNLIPFLDYKSTKSVLQGSRNLYKLYFEPLIINALLKKYYPFSIMSPNRLILILQSACNSDLSTSSCTKLCLSELNLIGYGKDVTEQHLIQLSKIQHLSIERLFLTNCHSLTDQTFNAIFQSNCINDLSFLDLTGCENVSESAVKSGLEKCSDKLIELRLGAGTNKITPAGIRLIIKSLPHLKTLDLSYHKSIKSGSFNEWPVELKELTTINLSRCILIKDSDIEMLAKKCPNLESLYFNECAMITKSGVEFLLKTAKKLKFLSLTGCTQVSPDCINLIRTNYPHITLRD